ncbi:MAG: hypothetical protein K0Q79_710 [Flavipsychrobacter sp.]|jgi:hypothetical protein|nr:hypothetical protein [Flavipsychrobacter sp.]
MKRTPFSSEEYVSIRAPGTQHFPIWQIDFSVKTGGTRKACIKKRVGIFIDKHK